MKHLRQYIRQVLVESRFKQMSKPKFTDLKGVLQSSSFATADPEGDGIDDEDWSSEAAEVLKETLDEYFDSRFGPGEITTIVNVDFGGTPVNAGPDAALKDATYFFDGKHNVEIRLASIEGGAVLQDLGNVAQKVYEVIMHELLHMQQFLKFSRGEPTVKKWKQFMAEYEKRGGATGMGGDYFFFDDPMGPSELETFSLQLANELVNSLGKEKAVKVLQQQNPDYDIIKKNSRSFRDIEDNSPGMIKRPELRDMVKRAKQYAKRMK